MQAGLLDAQTALMLVDFADVEAFQSLALSATRQALWLVDQVIYEGAERPPREWYDLGRCIRFMQMGMANAEMEGAPEEVMNRGLEFIAACNELMTPPAPPPSPLEGQQTMTNEQALQGMPGPQDAMAAMAGGAPPPDMGAPPAGMPPMGPPPTPQQGMM